MIAALDVHYDEPNRHGRSAAVLFENWDDAEPVTDFAVDVENVEPYVPGEFFRRELPCLLAVLAKIDPGADVLVIDGYVRLDEKPGLGEHLFQALERKVPVIGVAKTRFIGAPAFEVLRGKSSSPLFVSSMGMDTTQAADRIARMHGRHRIPTLLKRVDHLARGICE